MRPNEFQARPERFRGGVTMGVAQYPGFHTAENEATTYVYAQQKVAPETVGEVAPEDVGDYLLDDYPVVVRLDMSGLRRLVDYDAVNFVRPRLADIATAIMDEAERDGTPPVEALEEYVEYGEDSREQVAASTVEYLYQYGAPVMEDPSGALLEVAWESADADKFLRSLAAGTLSDEDLAVITGQYRYTEDVSTKRIVAVHYLKPWWPKVLDWEIDHRDEELFRAVQQAGWNVISIDDVMSDQLEVMGTKVYERVAPIGSRIEYHGTSYHNLASAAPELELPVPPPPYEPDEG